MAATPLMVITQLGLATASQATPVGPFIHITKFSIGSAYGYTPTPSDTGLNGDVLYEGLPISYAYVGDDTINIICKIPADAGPFDFGEVALWQDGGVMFAKAAFDSLQTKFSSLGTNLQSTFTFNCLLKLAQAPAVFQIDTESDTPPAVWQVDRWSDIYPPALSANPDIPLILVHELSSLGDSSLLTKATDEKWSIASNYDYYGSGLISNGSTTVVDIPVTGLPNATPTSESRKYVVEFADGFIRSVASVVLTGSTYRFTLNPEPLPTIPTLGSILRIYRDAAYGAEKDVQWADIQNVPLATRTTQGIMQVGDGLRLAAPGIPFVTGLNHGAPGTGNRLVAADNLNNPLLPSGIYTMFGNNWPVNYPPGVNWPGNVQIVNTAADTAYAPSQGGIIQTWYPFGTGGGSASGQVGKDGLPMYFRSWVSGNTLATAVWTEWFPYTIGNKRTPGSSPGYTLVGTFVTSSGIIPINTRCFVTANGGTSIVNPQNAADYDLRFYVNGTYIGGQVNNLPGWSKSAFSGVVVQPGDSLQVVSSPYHYGNGRFTMYKTDF